MENREKIKPETNGESDCGAKIAVNVTFTAGHQEKQKSAIVQKKQIKGTHGTESHSVSFDSHRDGEPEANVGQSREVQFPDPTKALIQQLDERQIHHTAA